MRPYKYKCLYVEASYRLGSCFFVEPPNQRTTTTSAPLSVTRQRFGQRIHQQHLGTREQLPSPLAARGGAEREGRTGHHGAAGGVMWGWWGWRLRWKLAALKKNLCVLKLQWVGFLKLFGFCGWFWRIDHMIYPVNRLHPHIWSTQISTHLHPTYSNLHPTPSPTSSTRFLLLTRSVPVMIASPSGYEVGVNICTRRPRFNLSEDEWSLRVRGMCMVFERTKNGLNHYGYGGFVVCCVIFGLKGNGLKEGLFLVW